MNSAIVSMQDVEVANTTRRGSAVAGAARPEDHKPSTTLQPRTNTGQRPRPPPLLQQLPRHRTRCVKLTASRQARALRLRRAVDWTTNDDELVCVLLYSSLQIDGLRYTVTYARRVAGALPRPLPLLRGQWVDARFPSGRSAPVHTCSAGCQVTVQAAVVTEQIKVPSGGNKTD